MTERLTGSAGSTKTKDLAPNGNNVGSFAVINSSTGNNQNVIFDVPAFSVPVPEPSACALLGVAVATLVVRRRRS